MIKAIEIIARNTFKEVIRDRVLYILVLFTLILMGLCFAIAQLSFEEIFRLSVSLGLGSIHLCFSGLTIFLGTSLFFREIENGTIYTILVRPIERWQYLMGKYLGLLTVMVVLLAGFCLSFGGILLVLGLPLALPTFLPLIGIFMESCILLAATFFFASFLTPYIAVGGAISLFLVGHWIGNLESLIQKSQSRPFQFIGQVIVYSFPDLGVLNWRDNALAQVDISRLDFTYGLLVTVAWAGIFISLAQLIFNKRNFE